MSIVKSHANTVVFLFTANTPTTHVIPRRGSKITVLFRVVLKMTHWLDTDFILWNRVTNLTSPMLLLFISLLAFHFTLKILATVTIRSSVLT